MCGLVAIFSRSDNGFTADEMGALELSMLFNQMRGDDSTGLVGIDKAKLWHALKNVGGWKAFTRHSDYDHLRKIIYNKGVLAFGHGRAATRGVVNFNNSHPFVVKKPDDKGDIVLVHNGTLDYDQPLGDMWKVSNVDSEWMAHMIALHGAEKALSSIHGAIATIWWDSEDKSFNFYRNDARPLYFMMTKGGAFYMNSELATLQFLNLKFKLGVSDKNIHSLEDQNWHKAFPHDFDGFVHCKIKKPTRPKAPTPAVIHSPAGYSNLSPFPAEDKEFWDRSIESIDWIQKDGVWEKQVRYRVGGGVAVYRHSPPPKPDLIRTFENKTTGDVTEVFRGMEEGSSLYVTKKYSEFKAEKKSKEVAPSVGPKEGNGILVKFTTRTPTGNKKIKHRAYRLKDKGHPWLERYQNTLDEEIKVGDVVTMEVLYLEDTGRRNKVVCGRVKQSQDMYIDLVFHTDQQKEELLVQRFFKAQVGSLRLADGDELQNSGSYCIANVYNVKPVNDTTGAIVNAPEEQKAN